MAACVRAPSEGGLAIAALAIAAMGPGAVHAQNDTGTMTMDPVTVTATRNPIAAFTYPGMVSVKDREEIQRKQASTPDDILRDVPNVEFTGGPRRTGEVPSIRGFSGPDVVVTLDGARQNFISGHDGRFFIDPSLLREVEVLRGPASSLYGSGGTGGVIALRTVRARDLLGPGERVGGEVRGGYQSVNEETVGTATAYGRPSENLGFLGSITKRDTGDIELGDGSTLDRTDNDIVSGLGKANWQVAPGHSLEASFQAFRDEAEEPNNAQGRGGDNLVEKDIRSDTARLRYRYSRPDDDLFDVSATGYYTVTEADELRLDNQGAGPAGELLTRDVTTIGFRVENRSRARLPADTNVTFTYGVEGFRDAQNGAAGGGDRPGVPDATAHFGGAFVQAEARIPRPFGVLPGKLFVIPGLRFDHYEASSDVADGNQERALSPRIGLSYQPTDWSLLFANYGRAFRAPTVGELFTTGVHFRIPGVGTNRFVPNPDLDPQRTQTIEFGGGLDESGILTANDRAHVKVSHFITYGEDFIDQQVNQPTPGVDCNPGIPGDCDGTTRAVNIADARLTGTEVEAGYENGRVRVDLAFSTLDGENRDTGDKLGVLTPPQVNLDTALKLPEVDSTVGTRVRAADDFEKVNDPANERDGYVVNDIYATWSPQDGPLSGMRLDLGVDNVFDTNYSRVFTGAPEPGRNFKVALSYGMNF